jgi:hypothetical protein
MPAYPWNMRRWLTCALLLAGCGKSASHGNDGGVCDPTQYPCGAIGFMVGSTMANVSLDGRKDVDKNGNPLDDPFGTFTFASYYKDATVKVLGISISAEWCSPCRNEQPALVSMFANYRAANAAVAFVEPVVQNAQGGPATQTTIDNWATTYSTNFDIGFDPMNTLNGYYDPQSFPMQMVVRTRDMSILYASPGQDAGQLKSVIDQALTQP